MRKFKLLLFATLVAGSANAQYFQHVYGSQRTDVLESGVNANAASPQGHIMAGYTDVTGLNSLMVTRTNLNGIIAAPLPVFNNRYQIFENAVARDAKGRRVVHSPAFGGRISVWGDYGSGAGTTSTRFFYTLLMPNGAPGPIVSYGLPFPVVEAEATSMCNSTSNPANMYVCGFVRLVAGGQRYPVVMCINGANGAIIWANVYQVGNIDWIATDLVESPYSPDVALSGHFTRPGFPSSGCFFMVANGTGAPTPLLVEYGTPFAGNAGGFNSIAIANNPLPTTNGFVLGGFYNNPASGNDDSWALKVSPNGMLVEFSNLIDYTIAGNNNYGNDIIERVNSFGAYEYFLGGYVTNGFFGAEDDVVFKLDFAGNPVGGGQFTYGGPGNERVIQLDQYNVYAPNNNGLSTYGITSGSFAALGVTDFYLVKSYFNGVTRCNFDLQTPPSTPGRGIFQTWTPIVPYSLLQGVLTMNMAPMQDFEICRVAAIAGGSNARLASATQEIMQPGYFPNPVSRDNAIVTVNFGNETVEGVAEVELWNSLGQLCWTKQVSIADGQTNMQVELGNELEGGMYHLIVRQKGTLNNYRILVQ